MNLMAAPSKTLDDFGEGTLCAVLVVKKRGKNGEPQISPPFEPIAV